MSFLTSFSKTGVFDNIVKLVDETVNNSDTLQDDNDFKFTGKADKVYHFILFIHFFSSSATPDFKEAWTLPSGATGLVNDAAWSASSVSTPRDVTTSTAHLGSDDQFLEMHGIIVMGSTAGTVQLQWAQNTATVVDSIMKKGSVLIVYES